MEKQGAESPAKFAEYKTPDWSITALSDHPEEVARPLGWFGMGIKMFRTLSMTFYITRFTDLVAVLGVVSWINQSVYKYIMDFSEIGGMLMPILGAIWLGTQIWVKLAQYFDDKEDHKEDE